MSIIDIITTTIAFEGEVIIKIITTKTITLEITEMAALKNKK
jgi:hypothetical protein